MSIHGSIWDNEVKRVMDTFGMGQLQAYRHVEQRRALIEAQEQRRRDAVSTAYALIRSGEGRVEL